MDLERFKQFVHHASPCCQSARVGMTEIPQSRTHHKQGGRIPLLSTLKLFRMCRIEEWVPTFSVLTLHSQDQSGRGTHHQNSNESVSELNCPSPTEGLSNTFLSECFSPDSKPSGILPFPPSSTFAAE